MIKCAKCKYFNGMRENCAIKCTFLKYFLEKAERLRSLALSGVRRFFIDRWRKLSEENAFEVNADYCDFSCHG